MNSNVQPAPPAGFPTGEMSKYEKFEILSKFETQVEVAKLSGEEHMEADDVVIKHYNPQGLNGGNSFFFKGMRIFRKGESEKILKDEATPLAVRLHGPQEGIIEGRPAGTG